MKNIFLFLRATNFTCAVIAQGSKIDSSKYPRIMTFTAQQDHDNMMQQLNIKELRK